MHHQLFIYIYSAEFYKEDVLKNFAKSTGKHPYWSSFLIKLKISHLEHPSVWLLLILGKWFSQSYLWFNRKSFEIKLELFYEVISSMLHKKGNDFYNLRSQQTDRNWDCCKLWSNPIKHYLLKVSNKNTRRRCETYQKLAIETPEWRPLLYY